MDMILWHNPRCSKSRDTLQLLRGRGHDPHIRLYLNDPPTEEEIVDVLRRLGIPAIGLVRTREPVFAELDLADSDDNALVHAMAANPILIERPVLIAGDKAAIGRPPEDVLKIL